ncbi:hypothetical protein MSKU9_2347 [Komagataeibacter diospyri]|uniref:DNA 3'-5' helicase II n=1 Tax=Komagataeibacter diospyri TaxID=1932662 RepID=A0A4P5P233_9PROT|nr:hypothetical protein MSKU9_2347 [Komagataeibacter diospyri]
MTSGDLSVPHALASILNDLTVQQRSAAMALGRVLVLAGAGTGKTKTLTAGVATRIELHGMVPGQILCVTFTNRAAQEMRRRIASVLGPHSVLPWLARFTRSHPASYGPSPRWRSCVAVSTFVMQMTVSRSYVA